MDVKEFTKNKSHKKEKHSKIKDDEVITKKKHKQKKPKRKKEKKKKKDKKKHMDKVKIDTFKKHSDSESDEEIIGPTVEVAESSKTRAPVTKEEYEKQQSTIQRVFDSETNRYRIVKGSGEILEECVSRERQKIINKNATAGDGSSFQSAVMAKISKK